MPGIWNTSNPPSRGGAYFNFTAALQAAVGAGVVGTTAVVGTADWGPVGQATSVGSLGAYEASYSRSEGGTLREAALGALEGFDDGGAGNVLAYRVADSTAKAALLELEDAAEKVVKLFARYPGVRGNNFHVTVQANAVTAANKDIILYESGVEIERWENILEGKAENVVSVINASLSPYATAELIAGKGAKELKSIVGVKGGTGGFKEGASGLTPVLGDYTTALGVFANQAFDTIALANVTDKKTLDAFVGWLRDRNEDGKRCFGVIGGKEKETFAEAKARNQAGSKPPAEGTGYSDGQNTDLSYTYRNAAANLINLGATDLLRLSDSARISTARLAPRFAGSLAHTGFSRSMFYVKWTGYQVANPGTSAQYTDALNYGVTTFANDTTEKVFVEGGNTALITTNTSDRPEGFKDARTVAICHFIENTLTAVASEAFLGTLANNQTGRNNLVGAFTQFLKDLEGSGALVPGESTVKLDDHFVQSGDAVYLFYEILPLGVVKRIFSTVAVKA